MQAQVLSPLMPKPLWTDLPAASEPVYLLLGCSLSLSGFTNLVDLFQTLFEWNDDRDGQAIFKFMKSLDTADPCWQRTIDINILEAATEHGVQAVSLQALCIFGAGTGLFN